MSATWLSRTEISPGTAGSWQDVDLDSLVTIAGGAGVAIVEIRCITGEYAVGLRNNGSTDARTNTIYADASNSRQWAVVPFDADHILEIFRGNANVTFWIHGYATSGVTGYTNGLDRSIASTTAWTDLTALPAGATGGIYEIVESGGADAWGLRMNGSTDNRLANLYRHAWFTVGADGSRLVEGRINAVTCDFFELGYWTADVAFNTNGVDRSLAATGAWTDLTALSTGATGGIIEAITTVDATWRGVRRNGDTFDPGTNAYFGGWRHCMGIAQADASRLIEGYIDNVANDFFEVGVFTSDAVAAKGYIAPAIHPGASPVKVGRFFQVLRAYVAAAADGAALAATVNVVVTVAAALTTTIRLIGALPVVVATAGILTTAIRLISSVNVVVTVAGVLTTQIRLSATAPLIISTAGVLTTQIRLVGSVLCSITTAANLTGGSGAAIVPQRTVVGAGV